MKTALALSVASIAFLGLAHAATAPATAAAAPRHDGKVIVENQKIAEALRTASSETVIHEAVAREIGPLLYADNKLTPNESDLLFELMGNGAGRIAIAAPDGTTFSVPPLTQAASAFLALSDPPDLDQLWLQGTGPMRQLIDVTLLNPFVEGQVQRFIGQQFYLSWAASNGLNDYKPLRATMAVALDQLSTTNPLTQKQARKLFHNAMADVDLAAKGSIPDGIYAGLQPEQAAGN